MEGKGGRGASLGAVFGGGDLDEEVVLVEECGYGALGGLELEPADGGGAAFEEGVIEVVVGGAGYEVVGVAVRTSRVRKPNYWRRERIVVEPLIWISRVGLAGEGREMI
jgi:hypothetical protein